MKHLSAVVLLLFILTGCANSELDMAMQIRENILQSKGCSFEAVVTADYGEEVYTFSMACQSDESGNLEFIVTEPQTIAGITGTISDVGGQLTFDGHALAFELLADGQISPVSSPWILLKTLRSGYINGCTKTENGFMAIIHDSYEEDALQLDIWFDEAQNLQSAEILWDGRRILSLEVSNFLYL